MARALLHNALAVAGMFFIEGDPSTFHNLDSLPVFDPLTALLALMGLGVSLGAIGRDAGAAGGRSARLIRDRGILLVLWFAIMLLPTLLSDRPPNYSRAIAALPVIVLLPALGLRWLMAHVDMRYRRGDQFGFSRRLSWVLTAGAIAWAGLWTSYHYFILFGSSETFAFRGYEIDTHRSYDVDKHEVYDYLRDQAERENTEVFPTSTLDGTGHPALPEPRWIDPISGCTKYDRDTGRARKGGSFRQ